MEQCLGTAREAGLWGRGARRGASSWQPPAMAPVVREKSVVLLGNWVMAVHSFPAPALNLRALVMWPELEPGSVALAQGTPALCQRNLEGLQPSSHELL